ncbi:D-lactaldehyde dehydrogenase [Pseudohyphozyma bogoriensis]|nr:D-lactaldehyde dehydrogenase [Pseudohyphozyma bogoriensis]
MPVVEAASSTLVLVTGCTGYLAAHVTQQLLRKGFSVRGTVRSKAKGEYLDDLFRREGIDRHWEWVVVEDLQKDGAFNEAVRGVDAIEHTASPFTYEMNDPWEDLIHPAVNGTLALLNAALMEPKVKRVVITSSIAAIMDPKEGYYTFTENDWNEASVPLVEKCGKEAGASQAYRASKTLAEQAAWKFVKDYTVDGKAPFDITTVNPSLIFGPPIHQFSGPSGLNASVNIWYQFLLGNKTEQDAITVNNTFVDVRDVAAIHVAALTSEAASNQRFIVNNGTLFYQAFLDYLHSPAQASLISAFPNTIKGIPGYAQPLGNVLDASKAKRVFGWEPIPWEETVEEDIDELVELRARQRTFDGAYVRTALGNFGYALIILKVFTPEFAKIGLLYVILSSLLLIVSSVRAKRSDHDFADIYRPTTSIVRDDPASVLEPGPRIWGRPFRTSGYVVVLFMLLK